MKNIWKSAFYATLATALAFASCNPEEEEEPTLIGPALSATSDSIFVNGDVSLELNESSEAVVRLTATKGDTTLMSVSVLRNDNPITDTNVTFTGFDAASVASASEISLGGVDVDGFTGDISIPLSDTAGSWMYTITVTDYNNIATEMSFTVTISSDGLSAVKTGRMIYNLSGPNHGAFDLDGDSSTASTGVTSSDIQDQGAVVWLEQIATENGAMMVDATSADYDAATLASITAIYDAGTASSDAVTISVGDVVIVKTSEGAYSIIKFTEVNNTPADNEDHFVFNYRIGL